jgi:hypothetical protein
MRALLFTTIVLVGCTKQNPDFCPAHPDDPRCGGMSGDGGMGMDADGSNTTTDAILCLGTGSFRVCFNEPTTPISFGEGAAIDTVNAPGCLKSQPADWMAANQLPACFMIGTTINVPSITVSGSRPLVLIATGNLNINGILDAASHNLPTPTIGPGSPAAGCTATAEPGDYDLGASKEAGGGGAGGSFFNLAGKSGGAGDVNTAAGGIAAAALTTAPVLMRAGCNGQNGGDGTAGAGSAGKGGPGGGVVYLLAGGTIAIAAAGGINASGAGAGASGGRGGGGGGGSGGMIVLDANSFTATMGARLMANGGGGGPGANNGGGAAGSEPSTAMPLAAAPSTGGCGNGCGAGGQGAAQGTPAGVGQDGGDGLGGGGGGGGLGYIRVNKALPTTITASPTPDVI